MQGRFRKVFGHPAPSSTISTEHQEFVQLLWRCIILHHDLRQNRFCSKIESNKCNSYLFFFHKISNASLKPAPILINEHFSFKSFSDDPPEKYFLSQILYNILFSLFRYRCLQQRIQWLFAGIELKSKFFWRLWKNYQVQVKFLVEYFDNLRPVCFLHKPNEVRRV